jgi:tetratricopeptide (TPR) repeat protein
MRLGWVAGLALLVSACAETAQERARFFAEDGAQLYARGCYEQARQSYEVALSIEPANAALWYKIGQCHELLGHPPQAEQAYRQCIQNDPNNAQCRHALTTLLLQQHRRDEAVSMVHDWLARQPERADALAEDGYLYEEQGDLISALKRYQQALACNSRDNNALLGTARVFEAMHYPKRARALYERALSLNPNQPEVVKRVGILCSEGGGAPDDPN